MYEMIGKKQPEIELLEAVSNLFSAKAGSSIPSPTKI